MALASLTKDILRKFFSHFQWGHAAEVAAAAQLNLFSFGHFDRMYISTNKGVCKLKSISGFKFFQFNTLYKYKKNSYAQRSWKELALHNRKFSYSRKEASEFARERLRPAGGTTPPHAEKREKKKVNQLEGKMLNEHVCMCIACS